MNDDRLNFLFNKDRLITKPLPNKDPSILPSPEDLKYKVLIRVSIKLFMLEKFHFLLRVKKHQHQQNYKNMMMMMILH